MNQQELVEKLAKAGKVKVGPGSLVLILLGVVGLGVGFFGGSANVGFVALYVSTAMAMGLGMFGALLSAIFELTGAKWGRPYRRLAEGSVVLMPIGLAGLLVLLIGAGSFVPWLHAHTEFEGGKALWLSRGFWSARLLVSLGIAYATGLTFVYYSIRRDFCVEGVRETFTSGLGKWLSKGIKDTAAESERCSRKLVVLAPVVAIVYALTFTMLGFDFIMALEPGWFSTLFGAWYFIGHLLSGMALLAVVSLILGKPMGLTDYLTEKRQRDLATLLLAFVLVNVDFFWSQYLTIWYGNLPEETEYIVTRVLDTHLPWSGFSYLALFCFFLIPMASLIFQKVKLTKHLLIPVALIVVSGIFLARLLEIAPPILQIKPGYSPGDIARPIVSAVLVLFGFAGLGWRLYRRLLSSVPMMPVGDTIFARIASEHHD